MKKVVSILIVLMMLIACVSCGSGEEPKDTRDTSGALRMEHLVSLEIMCRPDKTVEAYTLHFYNDYGLIMQDQIMSGNKNPNQIHFYEYDEHGNMTKWLGIKPTSENDYMLLNSYDYEYDESNRLILTRKLDKEGNITQLIENTYGEDGLVSKTTVTEKGNVTEYVFVNTLENGKLVKCERMVAGECDSVELFTYDASGRVIEDKLTDGNGTIQSRTVKTYDADGNVTKQVDYDGTGTVTFWCENEYDSQGRISVYREGSKENVESLKYEYIYDSNGDLVSKKDYRNGAYMFFYSYYYEDYPVYYELK